MKACSATDLLAPSGVQILMSMTPGQQGCQGPSLYDSEKSLPGLFQSDRTRKSLAAAAAQHALPALQNAEYQKTLITKLQDRASSMRGILLWCAQLHDLPTLTSRLAAVCWLLRSHCWQVGKGVASTIPTIAGPWRVFNTGCSRTQS